MPKRNVGPYESFLTQNYNDFSSDGIDKDAFLCLICAFLIEKNSFLMEIMRL
jgi:hypothetical protein